MSTAVGAGSPAPAEGKEGLSQPRLGRKLKGGGARWLRGQLVKLTRTPPRRSVRIRLSMRVYSVNHSLNVFSTAFFLSRHSDCFQLFKGRKRTLSDHIGAYVLNS